MRRVLKKRTVRVMKAIAKDGKPTGRIEFESKYLAAEIGKDVQIYISAPRQYA